MVRSPFFFLKKRFSRKITILFISPKLLLFPDHVSPWSIYLQQLMPAHRHSCIKHTPLHFLFQNSNHFQNLHIFAKLCTWSSRASQLSISEDSAIRIVLPSAEVARFTHTHPVTHRVCHVPPYQMYAKLSHRS